MPVVLGALILSLLPEYVVWAILVSSAGYLALSAVRTFNTKKKGEKE